MMKTILMNKDPETEFLAGLIELQYGQQVVEKLGRLSVSVMWARGWPQEKGAFWNAEAFMWSRKIEKEIRVLIADELKFLSSGRNLDIGCGAHSYIPSVGFDVANKMLEFNDTCYEKVEGDLEEGRLPFAAGSFESVTAVFVMNYVHNYGGLLNEMRRILKPNGHFVMVLSAKNINEWQRQKEVNQFDGREWEKVLMNEGFEVEFYQKGQLWFLKGRKKK